MLPVADPAPPPPPPPAATVVIEGEVLCPGACPKGAIHVLAYPATDRYHYPWWDAYGFLRLMHEPGALDAMRPQPLAAVTLVEGARRFKLELPRGREAHLFALLDADGSGEKTGATAGDWIARFPRNPLIEKDEKAPAPGPLTMILYPLAWSPDYGDRRYTVPAAAPAGAPAFTDVTAASGIDFRHCQGGDLGNLPTVVGSGAALEDLDGDGDLDLVAVQGLGECPGAPGTTRYFRNDGKGAFTDATAEAGLGLAATGMGVVAGDYDHDGNLDLYFTTYQGGRLYHNLGSGRFEDVTATAGVGDTEPEVGGANRPPGKPWPVAASFGDVDGDGLLDLFVVNYVSFSTSPPFTADAEVPSFTPPMLSSPFAFPAQPDVLYRNHGDGRFVPAPDALGAADPEGKGMAAVLADLDHDGDLDLHVTNDCSKARMFVNRGGRLRDVSRAAGVDDLSSGMGIALGDLDGDGLPEVFTPHWLNEPRVLYRNASSPDRLAFPEATAAAGLAGAGNGVTGWAAEALDVDLDGDLDLVVTNGHTHPGKDPRTLEPQPLQLFLNDGKGRFADASAVLNAAAGGPRVWRGMAAGDVDGDGDLDLYLVAWNGKGMLLRNDVSGRHWLTLRLQRKDGERGGIGSRVEVEAAGRKLVREVVTGTGYLSHSSLEVEVGLGAASSVDRLTVVWPGGKRESFPAPAVDRAVTLIEGRGSVLPAAILSPTRGPTRAAGIDPTPTPSTREGRKP